MDQILNMLRIMFCSLLVTEQQLYGDRRCHADIEPMELHWSSYKSASSSPYGGSSPKLGHHQRPSTCSLPPDAHLHPHSPQSPTSPPSPTHSVPASPFPYPSPVEHRKRFTPPPTPPLVKPSGKGKFPTTPPPKKKITLTPDMLPLPLTKSKSHESQLSGRVNQDGDLTK